MSTTRGYHWTSRAWYADACRRPDITDEVTFGLYCTDGGTTGEMTMKWVDLGPYAAAQLCVFNDAWKVLASMTDLIGALGRLGEHVTAEQFCAVLRNLGFKDLTAYATPERYRIDHPIP
jgi:hypothetical protein